MKPSQHRRRERRHAAQTAAKVFQADSLITDTFLPYGAEEADIKGNDSTAVDEGARKHENHSNPREAEQVSLSVINQEDGNFVADEIELTEISVKVKKEFVEDDLVKIEGEYKNPNFKSWSKLNPEEEVKIMWEAIRTESEKHISA